MASGNLRMQILATCSATLAFFISGTCIGWPSPILSKLQNGEEEPHITPDQGSWVVSLMPVGQILTPLLAGYLADHFGRKAALLSTSLPFIISWVMIILAQSVGVLYAARVLAGLGLGVVFTVGPMYMGEISEDRIRGALGTVFQVMMNLGILFVYCVGPYVSPMWLGIASAIFPIFFVLIFFWMPESPYYYLLRNRRRDAEIALVRLRCVNSPDVVREELDVMERFVEHSRTEQGSLKDLIGDRGNRKALVVVLGLILIQNLSGINALLSYSTDIFQESNTNLEPSVSVMIIGAVQVLLSLASSSLVDIAGRRPMLLISSAGCAFSLGVEALFLYLKNESIVDVSGMDWIPVCAIVLYLIVYTLGIGPLPLAMLGELFPTNVKGLAASITCMTLAMSTVVVTKLYQVIADGLGIHVVFFMFSVCCVVGTGFIIFTVPETKGKSFEDIKQDLRSASSRS